MIRDADLPERMRTLNWAQWEINCESKTGDCTRHDCPCGRGQCRRTACAQCWRERIERLKAKEPQ